MAKPVGRRREVPTPELRCPTCGAELERFWSHCSNCGRRLEWRDTQKATGAECYYCGWIVSDAFSFCPWCGRDITDEASSPEPLKAPKGFKYERRCRWGCGGGVMYPMPYCPWCGRPQKWRYDGYQNICPHCSKGVDDWMDVCPWCGEDATGRDVIRKRWRDEISWNMLTGLILHELGHSFLYHNWSFTRTGRFRRAFGEVRKAYRVADSKWVDFERRGVTTTLPNYVTAYAATHPQEDFAETFRFYVSRRGRLRELFAEFGRKRKGVPVFEKFLVLHDYIRSLRGWR